MQGAGRPRVAEFLQDPAEEAAVVARWVPSLRRRISVRARGGLRWGGGAGWCVGARLWGCKVGFGGAGDGLGC